MTEQSHTPATRASAAPGDVQGTGPAPEAGASVSVRNVDAGRHRDMLLDAARVAIGRPRVGPSLIQRHVRVGFATAGRLLILLEDAGVIGPVGNDGKRDVLVPGTQKDAILALLAQEYTEAGGQA